MRITKLVEVSTEVEVWVDGEDIASQIFADEDSLPGVLRTLGNVASVLRGVPDERIREMTDPQRRTVETFLCEQAKRYIQAEE